MLIHKDLCFITPAIKALLLKRKMHSAPMLVIYEQCYITRRIGVAKLLIYNVVQK